MQTLKMIFIFSALLSNAFAVAAEKKKPSVKVVNVIEESVADLLQFPAQIQAKERSVIISEAQGNLIEITVSLGQKVKAGDTVAILQNTMPGYEFSKARLKSPIDGVVSQLFSPVGSKLMANAKILEIFNPNKLHAMIDIAAKDIGPLQLHSLGTFKHKDLGIEAKVKVLGVSPYIHPVTGTASAELEFLGDVANLNPGLIGSVTFRVKERNAYLIPETAITYLGNKPKVGIIEEGKYKLLDIKLGARPAGKIEVTEGLKSNDQLVIRASGFVGEGEEVIIEGQPVVQKEAKKAETEQTEAKI